MADVPYSPPSRNTADDDTLTGLFNLVLSKFLQNLDDMLPAQVIAYDRATNKAQVQVVIPVLTTAGTLVDRAEVASVPVFQYGAGGFVVSMPVKSGDMGWLKACDRDISLFKQTMTTGQPTTTRKHDFSDGMFFPDSMLNGVSIAGENSESLVIQSTDGSTCIALGANGVTITAPQLNIVGNVSITGTFINNAVDIGSTHVHTEVQAGADNSGPPL